MWEKSKGTTKCEKRTITCDKKTVTCDKNRKKIVTCDKNRTDAMLVLLNITMEPSNLRKKNK